MRMMQARDEIYFMQSDVCRIYNILKKQLNALERETSLCRMHNIKIDKEGLTSAIQY